MDYRIDQLFVDQLERIKIPKFQRSFVWTSTKQNDFIQTLHNGYPFGTLLVYPESSDKNAELQLLDGQQRLSTIRKYQHDPLQFWKPLNMDQYKQAHEEINALLDDNLGLTEAGFDSLIGKKESEVTDWLFQYQESHPEMKPEQCRKISKIVRDLKGAVNEYIDLKHLTVPMIVYQGGEEHLADVFANLNKGGVPLSKYEVFSASWINSLIQLAPSEKSPLQDQLLQYVKCYYMDMQKDMEFDLQNFSEDELTRDRRITLAEFGRALGQYVVDHLRALIPQSKNAGEEIGFGLLGVIVGLDNRKLKELNSEQYMDALRNDLEENLQKIKRICDNLQSMFATLLRRFKDTGDNYENGLSTTFKTLSYFAALWHFEPSSEEYKNALRNIKAAYVYDAITAVWSSHGDQRLLEYQQADARNYGKPIDVQEFKNAFDRWIDDRGPGINFSKEIKCLITIHANLSYLSASVPDGETFELEHIIARKRIDAIEKKDGSSRQILGNALGNCMYLPKADNNSKKDKNLYEVNESGQYDQLIEESQYFSQEEMDEIVHALESEETDRANALIQERSRRVAHALVDSLLKNSIHG